MDNSSSPVRHVQPIKRPVAKKAPRVPSHGGDCSSHPPERQEFEGWGLSSLGIWTPGTIHIHVFEPLRAYLCCEYRVWSFAADSNARGCQIAHFGLQLARDAFSGSSAFTRTAVVFKASAVLLVRFLDTVCRASTTECSQCLGIACTVYAALGWPASNRSASRSPPSTWMHHLNCFRSRL